MVLALSAVWSSGCESDSSPEPVSKEALPAKVAEAYCSGLAGCCKNAAPAFDVAACKTTVQTAINGGIAGVSANSTYDANAAGQCVEDFGNTARSCGTARVSGDACDRVFIGTVPLGGTCGESGSACAPIEGKETICEYDEADTGVCIVLLPAPHGAKGDSCTGSCLDDDYCKDSSATLEADMEPRCYRSDGLHCDSSNTCVALLAAGESCQSSLECALSTYCNTDTGFCEAKLADGSPCWDDIDCVAGNCDWSDDAADEGTCGKTAFSTNTCSGDYGWD